MPESRPGGPADAPVPPPDPEARGLDPLRYLPIAAYVDEVVGGATRLTYHSPRYEELTRISPDAMMIDANLWDERVHPDDRGAYLRSFERLWRDLEDQDIEYRFERGPGDWVWLHDRASAVRDAARGVTVVNGMLTDVTRRRTAEEAAASILRELEDTVRERTAELERTVAQLRTSEETLARAQELSSVGSFEWDVGDGSVHSSDELQRIYGVGPQVSPSSDDLHAFVHPDDRRPYADAMAKALAGDPPALTTFRIVRGDGSVRHLDVRADVDRDVGGAVVRVYGSAQDVTQRALAEAEIRRLNAELAERVERRTEQLDAATRELEAFAYSISHDVRAPLRTIDGFSAIVVEDCGDRLTEADLEHLGRVRQAAQRMGQLIDDLMGLSRVSRRDMIREPCDIGALAERVGAELRAEQPHRTLDLTVQPGLTADADTTLVRLILRELLDNAWKFTGRHETAHVEVGALDAGGERAFYVRDDGAGFDMRHAGHLFGAFQRMHAADEFEGDGIGLAIVQRLVRRHGGRVWAEAEVGKGATLFFTLPPAGSAGTETTVGA